MRDVNNGWILRYTHANVASFFFIFVYAQFYNIYFNLLFIKFKFYCSFYLKGVLFLNRTIQIFFLLYFNKNQVKTIMENFINTFKPSLSNSLNINKHDNINKGSNIKLNSDNSFLQWFSGFTDAEGTFKINIKNNKEVHFIFQITLHIDDVGVLFTIRDKLSIGIVSITGTTCSFRVHSFQVIIENLLPIFDKYPAVCTGTTLMWVKLSNSGDTLKLMIPNYIRNTISGWTNYSGMVTSHMMNENEMGYRGSKSELTKKSVKEQRVDGSLWFKPNHVRCTLMGFERNYQIKILSKQLNIKKFSTLNSLPKLNPWFVSGLIDAEGSFYITIYKDSNYKLGWYLKAVFSIGLHVRDLDLLLQLQEFFGGIGSISKSKTSHQNMVIYSVSSIKDLIHIIIPHFNNYLLLTQKSADLILFKKVVELMKNKEHLTIEGLYKIINIRASMNLGLSDVLKSEFIKFSPVERPLIVSKNIPDSNWVTGFTTGEGNFDITIRDSKSHILGYQVQLRFKITQHVRDIELMKLLIKYLGAGKIYKETKTSIVSLTIYKLSDITNKIIPFFSKLSILGVKQLDYLDFCKVVNLMNDGKHLTTEGLDLIRKIKSGMNTGRK